MNVSLPQVTPRLLPRVASLALFAVLCATVTYWAVTVQGARRSVPDAVMAGSEAASVDQAGDLFGSSEHVNHEVRLLGVLALGGRAAAAILSVGDGTPHAVALGGSIGGSVAGTSGNSAADATKLVEVRARSVVIEHNGVRSEVFLPTGSDASIYLR